jgi:hypothetical protein
MTAMRMLPLVISLMVHVIAAGLAGLVPPAAGAVVINEILADPASDWDGDGAVDIRGDEWVEVLNTGGEPVDLSAYWLRDDAAGGPRLNLFGMLGPGEAAVFYGSHALAWQEEAGQTAAGLSLNNGGDRVVLLRTVAGTSPLQYEDIDAVDYTDHQAEDDRSCGWNEDRDQWLLFDGLLPYGGSLDPAGTGCLPSPRGPNACGEQVAARDASLGSVKAAFR